MRGWLRRLAVLALACPIAVLPARGFLSQPLSDGVMAYVEGDPETAVTRLSEHLDRYPEDRAARKLLAVVQLQLGLPRRAVEILVSDHWQPGEDRQRDALLANAYLLSGADLEGWALLQQVAAQADTGELNRLVFRLEAPTVMVLELDHSLFRHDLLQVLRLLDTANHAQALALLAGHLEQHPDDIYYLFIQARSYPERDHRLARHTLSRLLELRDDFLPAWLELASLALIEERWGEAADRYRRVLEARPGQWDALQGLVRVASQTGEGEEARRWLEQAWRQQPDPAMGQLLVDTLLKLDLPQSAVSWARELVDRFPEQPESLRSLGLALLAANEGTAAVQVLTRLAQRTPDDARVWQLLATARLQTQDFTAAMAALEQARRLLPDDLATQLIEAEIYLLSERHAEALRITERIQAQVPEEAIGFQLEGDIHMQQRDFAAAARAYLAAFERGASAQSALLLNSARWLVGEHEAALTALRRWLAILPEDTVVRLQLAMQLQQLDRADEAIAEYERILEHNPNHVIALNNLAWLYLPDDPPRSVAYAETALEQAPERPEIADTLGWALARAGDYHRALVVLQQAVVQAPQLSRIRLHLATVQLALGERDAARHLLDELEGENLDASLRGEVEQLRSELQRQSEPG